MHPSYGRGDPRDETSGPGSLRILRNGKFYARREALGAARSVKFKDSSGKTNHWAELRLVNKHGSDFTLALFFDGPDTLPAELAHAINQVMSTYRPLAEAATEPSGE